MIAGTAIGSPMIHVLNTTASAHESLTLSWWCSSIGDLSEKRAIVAVFAVTSAIVANS